MNNTIRIAEEKFIKAITLISNKDTPFFEREALLLLEEASNLGHSEAMFHLANIYYTGFGSILKNPQKANLYFEKSYKLGISASLPFLIKKFTNENQPKKIIDKLDELLTMIKEGNEFAAQAMCFTLSKFSNEELNINAAKRKLFSKEISLKGFPIDRVPCFRINNE